MNCPFCESEEIKKRVIIKSEYAFVFPTNIPIVPGHLLICPNRCVATINDLTNEELKSIVELQLKMKKILVKVFSAQGFNYAWNEGDVAGQSVPHLHFYLIPRKEGDTGLWNYEPREFLYRPGSRESSPEAELWAVSDLIKKEL